VARRHRGARRRPAPDRAFSARLGTFNWTGGTLRLTDDFGVGTGEVFGDTLSVLPGRTLEVANKLNVTGPAACLL